MIRAIIWDWGGVLQRTEDPAPRHQLAAELGLTWEELERAVFKSAIWQQASLGHIGSEEAWASIVTSLGLPPSQVDSFVERFFAGDQIDQRLVRLIRHLRAQGLRMGLLSNAIPPLAGRRGPMARWGREDLFDAQVLSYQVGALKPDPRMYAAILAALQVPPAEALFIDDAPANVQGAKAAGMKALQFTGQEALLRDLAAYGLDVAPPGEDD